MKENKLSTQPYKGSRDFYPEDMRIREYIFNTWKRVCERYGYEMYDGPFLESSEIYEAKSGEEIVKEELYSFVDKGNRKVAIRPEMTPTLARMVAGKYKELARPIRWFSIPNLWRYEKPQRGRLREHFQLNVDTFGTTGIEADFEIISLLIGILLEFGAKEGMFEVRINNRKLMEDLYEKVGIEKSKYLRIGKIIDKKLKLSVADFKKTLGENISEQQVNTLCQYLDNPLEVLNVLGDTSQGAKEVKALFKLLEYSKLDKYIKHDITLMRGFDYYTGNVFELFDINPINSRSLGGGGRYDDLVELFIDEKIPGVGFGMGDVTMKDFLTTWNLLPTTESDCEYLITVWPGDTENYFKASLNVANTLRDRKKNTQLWLEKNTKVDKQLKYADRKGTKYAVIIGESEIKDKSITIKNLKSGKQETKSLENFFSSLE